MKVYTLLTLFILLMSCHNTSILSKTKQGKDVCIHIQARSNLFCGNSTWQLSQFNLAARNPIYETVFIDTLLIDKALVLKLINDTLDLKVDTTSYRGLDIRVLCTIFHSEKHYTYIAFDPHNYIYIKDMKKGMFREDNGQMYQWNEAFYENIKQYIPYKYP